MNFFNKKKKEEKEESVRRTSNASFTSTSITTETIVKTGYGYSTTTEKRLLTTNSSLPDITSFNRTYSLPPNRISKDAIPISNNYTPVYKRPSYGSSYSGGAATPSRRQDFSLNTPKTTYAAIASPTNSNSLYTKPKSPTSRLPPLLAPPRQPLSTASGETEKLLKIVVKKTKKCFDKNCKVPTYSTSGKKRGSCLIINNIRFLKEKSNRLGAPVDEKNLKALFQGLGFSIEAHQNLTAKKMEAVLKNYSEKSSLKYVDISVVIMMSHGNGSRDGNTIISGTDHESLQISNIIEIFDNDNCRYLENKPKIFIFQCCRGDSDQKVVCDTVPVFAKKKLNDMLLAYSTIPGFVSHRNVELGTWYIRALCKIFMEHACEIDVENMLKMVEQDMTLNSNSGYAQTSSYENRGFKRCYLNP